MTGMVPRPCERVQTDAARTARRMKVRLRRACPDAQLSCFSQGVRAALMATLLDAIIR
jgi:hypothetical protein